MKVKVKVKVKKGRKRRAAGWTLIALGLLVAGVWVWSGASGKSAGLWIDTGNNTETSLGVVIGRLELERWTPAVMQRSRRAWFGDKGGYLKNVRWSGEFVLGRSASGGGYTRTLYAVPLPVLSLPLLMAGGVTLWSAVRARRRAEGHACPGCGYSLAGLAVDAPCPECGKGAGTK